MRGLSAVLLATLALGRVHAAERAVAPIEVTAPLSAPAPMLNTMPAGLLGGGMTSLQPLDWTRPGTPAALAAQFLLPPSAIMGFARSQDAAQAPAPAQAQAKRTASSANPNAAQPASQPGTEAGLIPIEALGEGSRLPASANPRERLDATESALRAPLSQLRDAPADTGGESLSALSGRVWDMMGGRGGSVSGPNAGRSAFAPGQAAIKAASEPVAPAVPESASQAPLEPRSVASLSPAPAASPASLALVLLDVVEQKLSLSVSTVQRLLPGRELRLVKPDEVPAPFVAAPSGKPVASSAPKAADASSEPNAGDAAALPEFSWRAEAEMMSFGETGTAAASSGAEAAAAPAQQQRVIASDVHADDSPLPGFAPKRAERRAPPSPALGDKLAAALPFSALLALLGVALLAWPERR